MPLYDYKCESCEHAEEVLCSYDDPRELPCPKCGGTMHRQIGAPSTFLCDDEGWYEKRPKGPPNAD
jgi:putative FmdB family regulatory protein